MATLFYKSDYLSQKETEVKHFPSREEAEAWAAASKKKSRWFNSYHISNLDVDKMPVFLVISYGNGEFMHKLTTKEERHLT
jgi:hypothetical protein